MRVGWLVMGILALAPGVARGQAPVVRDVVIDDPNAVPSSKMSGHAGSALATDGSAVAAMLAAQALAKDPLNPWAHYRRAAALSDLQRTDEAVAEYKAAEKAFAGVDERGQSLAIYGRANTLAQAGRCPDAQAVFEQYAKFVEKKDAKGAALARSMAQSCRGSPEPPPPATELLPPASARAR
jgi:tetratricopeptide (TPR) repeat protein